MSRVRGRNGPKGGPKALGPDGKRYSTAGWEDWPNVERGDWGLVYIASMDRFGYYDDDDCIFKKKKKKRTALDSSQLSKKIKVEATEGEGEGDAETVVKKEHGGDATTVTEEKGDKENSDEDMEERAVVYLGAPLVSDNVLLEYDDLFQPPFEGDCRAS